MSLTTSCWRELWKNEAEEDFLLLVLAGGSFQRGKAGKRSALYHEGHRTEAEILSAGACPRQQKFLSENQEMFEKIREQEKEVEELSVESDRLRS